MKGRAAFGYETNGGVIARLRASGSRNPRSRNRSPLPGTIFTRLVIVAASCAPPLLSKSIRRRQGEFSLRSLTRLLFERAQCVYCCGQVRHVEHRTRVVAVRRPPGGSVLRFSKLRSGPRSATQFAPLRTPRGRVMRYILPGRRHLRPAASGVTIYVEIGS